MVMGEGGEEGGEGGGDLDKILCTISKLLENTKFIKFKDLRKMFKYSIQYFTLNLFYVFMHSFIQFYVLMHVTDNPGVLYPAIQ